MTKTAVMYAQHTAKTTKTAATHTLKLAKKTALRIEVHMLIGMMSSISRKLAKSMAELDTLVNG